MVLKGILIETAINVGTKDTKKSEFWEFPENEDKRLVGYKMKTEYEKTALSSSPGIEFILCTLGGEQFGR